MCFHENHNYCGLSVSYKASPGESSVVTLEGVSFEFFKWGMLCLLVEGPSKNNPKKKTMSYLTCFPFNVCVVDGLHC